MPWRHWRGPALGLLRSVGVCRVLMKRARLWPEMAQRMAHRVLQFSWAHDGIVLEGWRGRPIGGLDRAERPKSRRHSARWPSGWSYPGVRGQFAGGVRRNAQEACRTLAGAGDGRASDRAAGIWKVNTSLPLIDSDPGRTGYSALRSLVVDSFSSAQVEGTDIAGPPNEMLGPPPETAPGGECSLRSRGLRARGRRGARASVAWHAQRTCRRSTEGSVLAMGGRCRSSLRRRSWATLSASRARTRRGRNG